MMYLSLQKVQRILKDGEKNEKADASPVTIADYGKRQQTIQSVLHAATGKWPELHLRL